MLRPGPEPRLLVHILPTGRLDDLGAQVGEEFVDLDGTVPILIGYALEALEEKVDEEAMLLFSIDVSKG